MSQLLYSPRGYLLPSRLNLLENMRLLRRIIAMTLLVSFAGTQSAAAACVMPGGDVGARVVMEDANGAGHHDVHAHHGVVNNTASNDDASSATNNSPTSPQNECGMMMACTVAAPAIIAAVAPATPLDRETAISAPRIIHESPTLAFEPPPPRYDLI